MATQGDAHELRALREAGDSFKSSVFKLQLDEVLKEVAPAARHAEVVRALLLRVREALAAPVTAKATATDAPRAPYADLEPPVAAPIAFSPPSLDDINVIGSWSLHTAIRRRGQPVGVDLLVTIPVDRFEPKDFKDFRYARKAAHFLALLGAQLARAELPLDVQFERFAGNEHCEALLLTPRGKLGRKVELHVHVGPAQPVFPLRKLAPARGNLKQAEGRATPQYNWSVARAQLHTPFLEYLHAAAARAPGFVDAVRLGALWLHQRGYAASRASGGGFGSFEFAVLVAALLRAPGALLAGHSSYQLFRGALLHIAERPLRVRADFSAPRTELDVAGDGLPAEFLLFGEFDALGNVAPWTLAALRLDARAAIDMLNDPSRDRFGALFIASRGAPAAAADVHFDVHLPRAQNAVLAVDTLAVLLVRAWGARARCFRLDVGPVATAWALDEVPPPHTVAGVRVFATLDPQACDKRLTFVDEALSTVDAFRAFWGAKASLRRFASGDIREAVVWHVKNGLSVVEESAAYAVHQHLGARVGLDALSSEKLAALLPAAPGVGAAAFGPFILSFQSLQALLLDARAALPLRVRAVIGESSAFCYASVSVPQSFDPAHVAGCVLVLEHSGRWPRDPEAQAKVKTAFCVRLAEYFREQHPSHFALVSLETRGDVEEGVLTVQTPEGFYFKLRLAPPSEPQPLAEHTRQTAVHALRHPAFSRSARLFKLWLDRQMLSAYVPEPAAELLVLDVFVNSAPDAPPATCATAFFRVLARLARLDFKEDYVYVDLELRSEAESRVCTGCATPVIEFQAVAAAVAAQRKQDPAFTQAPLLLATNSDLSGTQFTVWEPRSRVAAVIAARLVSLAQLALNGETNLSSLFTPCLTDFDVGFQVAYGHKPAPDRNYKNLAVSDPRKAISQPRTVPHEMVVALRELYKDSLVLFYSDYWLQSNKFLLCGIWNRLASPPKRLKPALPYPVTRDLQMDKDAIIAEIERLGGGMLRRIE